MARGLGISLGPRRNDGVIGTTIETPLSEDHSTLSRARRRMRTALLRPGRRQPAPLNRPSTPLTRERPTELHCRILSCIDL